MLASLRTPAHLARPTRALRLRSDFWAKNYSEVKLANAQLPILVRESSGASAKLTATFGERSSPSPARSPRHVQRPYSGTFLPTLHEGCYPLCRIPRCPLTAQPVCVRHREGGREVDGGGWAERERIQRRTVKAHEMIR